MFECIAIADQNYVIVKMQVRYVTRVLELDEEKTVLRGAA